MTLPDARDWSWLVMGRMSNVYFGNATDAVVTPFIVASCDTARARG